MAVINKTIKEEFIFEKPLDSEALREERRRTGRYLAVGIVIFLVALGVYHTASYGSTQLSALLGAVLIMLLYLAWLLYASHRQKKLQKESERAVERHINNVLNNLNNAKALAAAKVEEVDETRKEENARKQYRRSYSIA